MSDLSVLIARCEEIAAETGVGQNTADKVGTLLKDMVNTCYQKYTPVTELPETLGLGEIVLFNGVLWRGLEEDESSLPTGTPWPVKGYKEFHGYHQSLETVTQFSTAGLITFTEDSVGYFISNKINGLTSDFITFLANPIPYQDNKPIFVETGVLGMGDYLWVKTYFDGSLESMPFKISFLLFIPQTVAPPPPPGP